MQQCIENHDNSIFFNKFSCFLSALNSDLLEFSLQIFMFVSFRSDVIHATYSLELSCL